MIYSPDINKVCAVCQNAYRRDENEMYCELKKQTMPPGGEACDRFKYDILKRSVKRMRRLKTDFDPGQFSIDED